MSVDDKRSFLGPLLTFMGASAVEPHTAAFLQVLAASLVKETHFRFATTNFRGLSDDKPSAAFAFADSLRTAMKERDVNARLFTYIVGSRSSRESFSAGTRMRLVGRTSQSQRLNLMAKSDVVCLLGGASGTREFYDLATAIEKPVLPLPFIGGAAKDLWNGHHKIISADFSLSEPTMRRWSAIHLARLGEPELPEIAKEVAETLIAGVKRRCFVIMPFHQSFDEVYEHLILPSVQSAHCEPIRTDRKPMMGDITSYLRKALKGCDCAVADVTGKNPNVLYEVGFAHAAGTPVILLQGSAEAGPESLPFDIRTHRTIIYPSDMNEVELARSIGEIHETIRAVNAKGQAAVTAGQDEA